MCSSLFKYNSNCSAEEPEPIIEEPESPQVVPDAPAETTEAELEQADASEDERAEPDLTDEE